MSWKEKFFELIGTKHYTKEEIDELIPSEGSSGFEPNAIYMDINPNIKFIIIIEENLFDNINYIPYCRYEFNQSVKFRDFIDNEMHIYDNIVLKSGDVSGIISIYLADEASESFGDVSFYKNDGNISFNCSSNDPYNITISGELEEGENPGEYFSDTIPQEVTIYIDDSQVTTQ